MEELLKRINELANKAKVEELDDAEKSEQASLRAQYLEKFRAGFKKQLMHVKVVDIDGEDVTPEKLKKEQEKYKEE